MNDIFGSILKIRTFFASSKYLNKFIKKVCFDEIKDDFFMEHFMKFLAIASILFKTNIKIIFGNKKIQKKPFFCLIEEYENDVLIGFDTEYQTFTLFYVLESFYSNNLVIRSNNKILSQYTDPKIVFKHFKAMLDSNTAKQHIKLVSQFSKTIPKSEHHHLIYLKESAALLYSLEAFKNEIRTSPLTLICTDSRVSFFMFNPNVQNSSKKLIRWSLKIALSYKNVHVLNILNFLSRLGLSKETFFTRTLCPLKINHEEIQKLPEILTWENIVEFCASNPNLAKFSEKKIDTKLQHNFYLDLEQEENAHNIQRLKVFVEQTNFLDKFLSREELIKNQFGEHKVERNGVLFFDDLPILPENLYMLCIMREHILG